MPGRRLLVAGCMVLCVVLAVTALAVTGRSGVLLAADDKPLSPTQEQLTKVRSAARIKGAFGPGEITVHVQGNGTSGMTIANVKVQDLVELAGFHYLVLTEPDGGTIYARYDQVLAVRVKQ